MPTATLFDLLRTVDEPARNGEGNANAYNKTAASIKEQAADLFRNTAVLLLEIKTLGSSRKVAAGKVETDADPEWLRTSKRLFDSPEYDAIKTHDSGTRDLVYSRSVPSPFKSGTYLVRLRSVPDLEAALRRRAAERAALVSQFIASYARHIDAARERLRDLFNPADYKTESEAAKAFSLAWNYVTIGAAEGLKAISADLYEQEAEKARACWAEATTEIRDLLRVQFAKLVDNMAERLGGDADGKPKVFRDTLVSNVSDFLGTFEDRNLTEDGELQRLVADARKLLAGVEPDTLRKSRDTRSTVAAGMARIQEQLDTMMIDRPGRAISFTD